MKYEEWQTQHAQASERKAHEYELSMGERLPTGKARNGD